MADYKELLRRAIAALPENNGAQRRAVYEKARSALVGQLRAITPPLPARDITQHRLQLEDCIRQVEQEASEAIIALGREQSLAARTPPRAEAPRPPAPRPEPEPVPAAIEPEPQPEPETLAPVMLAPEPVRPSPPPAPKPVASKAAKLTSIEDIIAQAAETSGAVVSFEPSPAPAPAQAPAETKPPEPVRTAPPPERVTPSIVARNDAPRSTPVFPIPFRPLEPTPRFEPGRDGGVAANVNAEPAKTVPRFEPAVGGQALARALSSDAVPMVGDTPVPAALSSVREVDVEAAASPDATDAQGVIERAIETLDRAARGESTAEPEAADTRGEFAMPKALAADAATPDDAGFAAAATPPRSGAGMTIFLAVFAVLLLGAVGAGAFAWQQGYVNLDQVFGQSAPAVTEVAEVETPATTPTLDLPGGGTEAAPTSEDTAGPGNTATNAAAEPTSAIEGLDVDERLAATPEAVTPTGTESVLPELAPDNGEIKTEERLSSEDTAVAATEDPAASVDPAVLAGSQSLLLEASADGRTGAVPFSGTIEWTEGVDEIGRPTLVGEASIPARNLGVGLTIRKNSDPSLPASHLMEVDFRVNDTFIGGSIANLPGVLLKDEELVPGTPLVGASARVVGNSFLFALSASEADQTTNTDLLENRKWLDLAVVYGTGRNAIITLEKDEEAEALFQRVFTAWDAP